MCESWPCGLESAFFVLQIQFLFVNLCFAVLRPYESESPIFRKTYAKQTSTKGPDNQFFKKGGKALQTLPPQAKCRHDDSTNISAKIQNNPILMY